MQDTEKFYPLKEFEGYYEITKSGLVRSVDRYVNTKGGALRLKKGVLKSCHYHRDGYLQVHLSSKELKIKCPKQLHRLLALTFIPNPDNLPVVNHIDGVKTNNNLDNLEWCTVSGNTQHNYDIGYKTPNRHLTSDDAIDIRNSYEKWVGTQKDFKEFFSNKYGVSRYVIHDIILNRSYKNTEDSLKRKE